MTDKSESLRDQVEAAFEAHMEEEVEVAESIAEDTEQQVADNVPESSEPEESTAESLEAPNHWAPEDIEAFNELDERGRRLYLKRHKQMEAGYTKKSQSLAEEKKLAERFKKALEPYNDQFKKHGIDEFEAFQRGATAHLRLVSSSPEEKMQLIHKLAMDYGVSLNAPPNSNSHVQQQQTQYDPATQAIFDQLNRHNQYLTNLEKQRQHQEQYTIEKTISDFSSAKDDQGELKYPHFDTIKSEMGHLISTGLASSLEEAYNKAIRLNEDLQQEYINRQYNDIKREEETVKKTVASKRAGFNVRGSGGSSAEPKDTLSRRQILERAFDAQTKRQKI